MSKKTLGIVPKVAVKQLPIIILLLVEGGEQVAEPPARNSQTATASHHIHVYNLLVRIRSLECKVNMMENVGKHLII